MDLDDLHDLLEKCIQCQPEEKMCRRISSAIRKICNQEGMTPLESRASSNSVVYIGEGPSVVRMTILCSDTAPDQQLIIERAVDVSQRLVTQFQSSAGRKFAVPVIKSPGNGVNGVWELNLVNDNVEPQMVDLREVMTPSAKPPWDHQLRKNARRLKFDRLDFDFRGASSEAFEGAFDQTLLDPQGGPEPKQIYVLVVHMSRASPLNESSALQPQTVQRLISNTAHANFIHLDCKAENMMLWDSTIRFVDLDDLVFLPDVDPALLEAAMTYQYCTRPRDVDRVDLSLIAALPPKSISELSEISLQTLRKLLYFVEVPRAVNAIYKVAQTRRPITGYEIAFIGQNGFEPQTTFSGMMYRSASMLDARRSASRLR